MAARPLTANEQLFDAMLRHQIYLIRYAGALKNTVVSLLTDTEAQLAKEIRDRLRNDRGITTPASVTRMTRTIEESEKLRMGAWGSIGEVYSNQWTQLAILEPSYMASMLATVAPVVIESSLPSARQLQAIVTSTPFEGALLRDWVSALASEDVRRITAAIQTGMVEGLDSSAIARRVIGTQALNGKDGIVAFTNRQIEALTRTAVAHVAAVARDLFIQENADIIVRERYTATLDSRTTPICRAHDGKTFPVGKGPRPPLHIRCRSVRVPVLNDKELGDRPQKPVTERQLLREFTKANNLAEVRNRKDLPRGMKGKFDDFSRKRVRELTGVTPSDTSYQEWLKRQSKSFQEDIMGITKAKLFRDGGLTLDKFVAQDGTELTLDQLARKHATAFRAAGLDPTAYWKA